MGPRQLTRDFLLLELSLAALLLYGYAALWVYILAAADPDF